MATGALPSWWDDLKDNSQGQDDDIDDLFDDDEVVPLPRVSSPSSQEDNGAASYLPDNNSQPTAVSHDEDDTSSTTSSRMNTSIGTNDDEDDVQSRMSKSSQGSHDGEDDSSSDEEQSCSDDEAESGTTAQQYALGAGALDADAREENEQQEDADPFTVLQGIQDLLFSELLDPLDRFEPPRFGNRSFSYAAHCRSITGIWLVASYVHQLLLPLVTPCSDGTVAAARTTTTREVFYHFVTHFRNQAECDKAIWELAFLLKVTRSSLGLMASPKGWCCGSLSLYDPNTNANASNHYQHDPDDTDDDDDDSPWAPKLMWNGRELDVQGKSTTIACKEAEIESDAKCIVVVEKEGVYWRLSEDRLFDRYPCILVCGKGFPDVATRLWVQHLQRKLDLPVYGLCDCNPFGLAVLHSYQYQQGGQGSHLRQNQRRHPVLRLRWVGLRPSHLEGLDLPSSVFQEQTELDQKRLRSLLHETHLFIQQCGSTSSGGRMDENEALRQRQRRHRRRLELEQMQVKDNKVELEALNWKGMDFLTNWVHEQLVQHEETADQYGDSDIMV